MIINISIQYMKHIISFLLSGLLFVTTTFSQEVVELKQPLSNKITIRLMFRNGSICDPAGKEGLTSMTATMLTEGGTGNMTKKDIREFLFPMAARYGSSVDKEVSVFSFVVPSDYAEQFYPTLKGLMLSPSFSDEDFKRVKSNQQNFTDQVIRASSDEDYSKAALEDLLFRGTNYQHMIAGKTSGVNAITLDDIKEQYKNFFSRNNLMIGIAGNYTAAFLARLKSDLNMLPSTTTAIPTPGKVRTPKGLEVEIISKFGALGSAIFTGAPLSITRSDNDFVALAVANSFLGEHRKSYGKLYDKIRSVRSMNYGDYSYIEWYSGGGNNMLPVPGVPRTSNYSSLWIRPVQTATGLKGQYPELKDINVGHAHFALRLAIREIDMLIKNGMTKKEFEDTRNFLRSYQKLYIQTPSAQLGFLMDSRFYGRKDYIKEADGLLAKLTVDDVNRAIKKYWQTENMFVTIVTDDTESGPLKKSLEANSPSPMSYSNVVKEGLPKDVLAEDDIIANYKLNVSDVKIVKTKETFK